MAALNLRNSERLQRADARGCQIARDSAHAHAILPVGGDCDVEHGVVETGILGEHCPDRRVVRQLDDACVVLAEFELARGAHHSAALDTTDGGDLQRHVTARDVRARRAEDSEHSGAGIWRTADDLDRLTDAGIDRQHLQLVGLRVLLCGKHARDRERRERFHGVAQFLDLQADVGQPLGDRLSRGVGVEVILQPR